MNRCPIEKIRFVTIFFLCSTFSVNPLIANVSRDHLFIDMLVMSCYEEMKFCNKALLKIHGYQKNAAMNQKFSCQTRLLGLEANLIMAMNSNFKRKDARTILDSLEKYC